MFFKNHFLFPIAHYFYFHIKIFNRSSEVIRFGFAASSLAYFIRNTYISRLVLTFPNYMVLILFRFLLAFANYFDVASTISRESLSINIVLNNLSGLSLYRNLLYFSLSSLMFNRKPQLIPKTLAWRFGIWKCFAPA